MLLFCLALLGAAPLEKLPNPPDLPSPAGQCQGTPAPCVALAPSICSLQKGCWRKQSCNVRDEDRCVFNTSRASCEGAGCDWGTGCRGIPDDCSSFPLAQCDYHAGCTADHQAQTCTGHPPDCQTHRDHIACGHAHGCTWENHCGVGAAPRCAAANTPWQCEDLEDCAWNHACGGHPLPCDAFVQPSDCAEQTGCIWQEPPPPPPKAARPRTRAGRSRR